MLVALFIGASSTLSACGASGPQLSSAAPPWKACGHVLMNSAAGPVVVDVSRWPLGRPITQETVGGLDLVLSHDCSAGAGVSFFPSRAAVVAKSVAADGGIVAAIIHPARKRFDIRITEPDGSKRSLEVRLQRLAPP